MTIDPTQQNWIHGLPDPIRDEVLACMHERDYAPGDMIYRTGEPGHELYQILRGNVRIFTISEEGRELLYEMFPEGACFGESSLIDEGPRPHMTQAVGDVRLRVLSRDDFEMLWRRYPEVSMAVARLQTYRARRLYGVYEHVSLNALSRRMADRLSVLAATVGEVREDGIYFRLRITQEDIGSLVVGSRQSVNKILKQWQQDNVIDLAYGSLVIRDLATLQRLATA
ncbi:Crp/Fnr family transcriptional regulator [Parahaliea maris]|uniref:Crp/Fnr family transcriptional regulator n=1 Tax=Parahaliea maris TaxID=2716870 RepID=A0A5C9A6Z7_9GAMM|nr:Crp/Fnr family transcriptional regulator [Parahaliea maris]TXS95784.1 Crp/Fnr family transcriptional regulator [Parahaliea maris]